MKSDLFIKLIEHRPGLAGFGGVRSGGFFICRLASRNAHVQAVVERGPYPSMERAKEMLATMMPEPEPRTRTARPTRTSRRTAP